MKRYFCTYFDHRYLVRGLAMYQSLMRHCPDARLWVLCLSSECYQALSKLALAGISLIHLEEFERGDAALVTAKGNRSIIEYYFTCTPSLPLYLLKHNTDIDVITYLDSDLYFYSDPEPLFHEMGDRSIAIIGHRFPPQHGWMEANGLFNVGWLSFRNNEIGLESLNWWRERCLEWCHDYIEGDKFADQKYLDRFPELFTSVKIIAHKGANLAAWNLGNYKLHVRGSNLWVDDQPVLFYHFQGLRKIAPGVIDPCVQWYGLRVSWLMERALYRPYIRSLRAARRLAAPFSATAGLFKGFQRTENLTKLLSAYRGVLTRRFLFSYRE